jgi:NAD(P)-dependent dehydrogenase (short-subunit alcohol dehydrogenase family)
MFRDNVIPAFVACKLAGRYMSANGGGSIILNSSTGSLRARGGTEAYGAAKAAVNHLTMTAACAFAGKGVRVNAILPGLTETGLTKPMFDKEGQLDADSAARFRRRHGRCGGLSRLGRFSLHGRPASGGRRRHFSNSSRRKVRLLMNATIFNTSNRGRP